MKLTLLQLHILMEVDLAQMSTVVFEFVLVLCIDMLIVEIAGAQ